MALVGTCYFKFFGTNLNEAKPKFVKLDTSGQYED